MSKARCGYETSVRLAVQAAEGGRHAEAEVFKAAAHALYLFADAVTAHQGDCDETRMSQVTKEVQDG